MEGSFPWRRSSNGCGALFQPVLASLTPTGRGNWRACCLSSGRAVELPRLNWRANGGSGRGSSTRWRGPYSLVRPAPAGHRRPPVVRPGDAGMAPFLVAVRAQRPAVDRGHAAARRVDDRHPVNCCASNSSSAARLTEIGLGALPAAATAELAVAVAVATLIPLRSISSSRIRGYAALCRRSHARAGSGR